MAYMPWFPEAGSYIRYYDVTAKEVRYRRLIWRRDPLTYPRRLPALSAGSKGDVINFDEINPSADKKHIYLAYLGVRPGFFYFLYHPYDIKVLKWDEQIEDINENLVANITYEKSPYEFPTKAIGIQHDRYPGIQAMNIFGETKTPEVVWMACLYTMQEHTELSADELNKLRLGLARSYPWDFGGEL